MLIVFKFAGLHCIKSKTMTKYSLLVSTSIVCPNYKNYYRFFSFLLGLFCDCTEGFFKGFSWKAKNCSKVGLSLWARGAQGDKPTHLLEMLSIEVFQRFFLESSKLFLAFHAQRDGSAQGCLHWIWRFRGIIPRSADILHLRRISDDSILLFKVMTFYLRIRIT